MVLPLLIIKKLCVKQENVMFAVKKKNQNILKQIKRKPVKNVNTGGG